MNGSTTLPTSVVRAACAILLAVLCGNGPARAADPFASDAPPGRSVESIRDWLRAHNPELRAITLDADAAGQRVQPAGALPDPMLVMELRDIAVERPRVLPGQVGSTRYELRQSFPLWGKRGLDRGAAQAEADSASSMARLRERELLRDAEQAYVRYWHASASLIASERIIATLEDLERLARSRYSAGLAAQQDAIRLQVERTRMLRERIERQALRRESAVRLNGLLARAPDASLDEPQGAPQLDVPPSALDPAVGDNAMHPAVAAEVALLEAAEQRRERVRRERYPDLTVGLAPIQVGNRLEAWELMFEVELPLQQASRRSREREAILMRDAASARRDAVKSRIDAEAAEARSAWEAAQAQRRLVESTLLPQTAASFESALGAYGAGTSDFSTLLDAQRERRSAELTLLDATRDALLAAATLRSLAGESP